MGLQKFKRLPKHIGCIPDGNRRWAVKKGLSKEEGYEYGVPPALKMFEMCKLLGIEEISVYGFTKDNTKRPKQQLLAFQEAAIEAVDQLSEYDVELMILGDHQSPLFPESLLPYVQRTRFGKGGTKVNLLTNYDWRWDIEQGFSTPGSRIETRIASSDISRIDLIIRWGGRRRLSGFLPIQSVYADFFVIDEYWPDFTEKHLLDALNWFQEQDITLGG